MDFFVLNINSYFMLGSMILTNGEVEFRSMKIPEIVLTEQTRQVAFGAQTPRKPQRHWVMVECQMSCLHIAAGTLV